MPTTHPRPRVPLVVAGASALALCAAAAAGAAHETGLAAAMLVVAIAQVAQSEALRRASVTLAVVVAAWAALALVRSVDSGARIADAFVVLACVLKIWALRTEAARQWCARRWFVEASDTQDHLGNVLSRALRAGTTERDLAVDAAVVALARAPAASVPRDESERRGLFIDAYNVLAQHARRGRRSRRAWDVIESYRVRYELFGATFTNDEIEHGVLRGNRGHVRGFSRRFGRADPRAAWVVALDPRVHFALNCGLRSCPLVRTYSGADSPARLEAATSFFVRDTTEIDDAAGTLRVSKLFEFYAADFGGHAGIRRFVARYLERASDALDGYELSFAPYDFSPAFLFARE
jgi:hypothetical protein